MSKFHPAITPDLRSFIERQPMYFVATAPESGRINLSPKGIDSFRVLGEHAVAYLDLTGSTAATAAHLRENGRITVMFCGFEAQPLILRLYGNGRMVRPIDHDWADYAPRFTDLRGARTVTVMTVESVHTACGQGVPLMNLAGQRPQLRDWADRKGADGIAQYQRLNNSQSIDGLPSGLFDPPR